MIDLKSEKGKALTKIEAFREIRAYLEDQFDLAQRKCMDEENFSKPCWSEFQAYQRGIQKGYTKLLNVIPDQGDK
jgi:hypothetical protein